MKIIILGSGQVGATLAENLVGEQNDITLVDTNLDKLRNLQDRFDLQVVHGHGSHPDILKKAGAEDADMIVAVTNSDEVNIVACQVAYSIFNTPLKIARIRTNQYLKYRDELFHKDDMPVDHFIAPEALVTNYIRRLIDYPGALQVVEFAEGKVSLVAVKAYYGGLLVGHALSALKEHMPNIETRVAAIYRRGNAIKPLGTTIIEADDEVFFVAATKHIRAVMSELQKLERSYRRIMIAGGGNVGFGLARALEKTHSVKLIERSKERAEFLASSLDSTLVYVGDISDPELLEEESVEQIDVFIAVTNDDEANIMSAMLAKRMGAQKTMVLIKRGAYVDLLQGGEIDIAISPQQATISALLTHIRRGDIVNVYSLRRGAAEAIEAVVRGDSSTSKVAGKTIGNLKLPPGTTIGAIVRGDEVLIAHDTTVIETDDHVILFMVNKKHIVEVEKLFQVSAIFI
ncbi:MULTISPECIES: Trk system potassium transporter TrkA [Arsukibacterium]|uniref:Trk system potassium uptake protein TrkA n=1 Tax=Arsukibacterium indicum TaxID=2848612 RepID=A0ABS6MN53_9GAMM|nr:MULTISPECIES: Trk system potassium transporter TrkA [Arsukibacterium]MAA94088.1 Trk system potassium transporter TrkA [Rheinheimera sp.]HAW93329.1 Trk system potassium transporter TrkA [Candidatus Azambacteria bacterium]MBM34817.1 Trk system potassium transporter TrkA [Rheinheimera sp.]MBV2130235.1 Trk system potassium transporter TrkA [Arsukibacterium indicum]MDX1677629.1 Trk system potassium transporter TrkA [Arsukibacterium sp.]|tara:strand:- start:10483 stop:11859 length:1377 start_codon:yes stop_codon:yes gene_type:complete